MEKQIPFGDDRQKSNYKDKSKSWTVVARAVVVPPVSESRPGAPTDGKGFEREGDSLSE